MQKIKQHIGNYIITIYTKIVVLSSTRTVFKNNCSETKIIDNLIESLKEERIWLPAKLEADGSIKNADVGSIVKSGARKGESNFKKQQKPVNDYLKNLGVKSAGTSLGTYVMNMHYKVERAETDNGKVYLEDNPDARILRYGQTIRKYKIDKGLRNFIRAAEDARTIIERRCSDKIAQATGTHSPLMTA